MATRPTTAAASMPTMNGPAEPGGSPPPRAMSLTPFRTEAPKTIGISRRKERRAARSRSRRRNRPAVIVIPERETLGEADRERALPPDLVDRAARGHAVREPENDGEDREQERDLPGIAELLLDEVLPGSAGDGRGDGRDRDVPGDALVLVLDASATDASEPGPDEPHDVTPEIEDDRDERSEMKRDVEGLVEVRMLLEIGPAGKPRDENKVTGRGDRKELGRALHDSEDECLPTRELAVRLPHAESSEHDGKGKSGACERDRDPRTAHTREYGGWVTVVVPRTDPAAAPFADVAVSGSNLSTALSTDAKMAVEMLKKEISANCGHDLFRPLDPSVPQVRLLLAPSTERK